MQKWFFLEDPASELHRRAAGDSKVHSTTSSTFEYPPRQWVFRVRVPEILPGHVVCVSGSTEELGSWIPEKSIPLDREEEDGEIWSLAIDLPDRIEIQYRFCVCVIVEPDIQVIVRNFESNITPRIIEPLQKSAKGNDEPLTYGDFVKESRVDRGWLNKETAIQMKLYKSPITIWRPKYVNRKLFIKVTPVNLQHHNSNLPKTMSEALDESLSTDTQDNIELPKHSFSEVATISDESSFKRQNQFGEEYYADEMMIFQCAVLFPQSTAFLFDFYVYNSRFCDGEPPYHAGFSYLLPSSLQGSEGSLVMPITSTKQRPLGEMKLEYLVVRPMPNVRCDFSLTYARHWKQTRSGLDVGHRGAGNSFSQNMKNCAEVRENTIASLKTAIDHGADFVEFDVQLSKDLVPII